MKGCQTEITNDYLTGLEMETTSLKEKLKLNSLDEEFSREDNDKGFFVEWATKLGNLVMFV